MNWSNHKKKVKEVSITFEYSDKNDLHLIFSKLKNLILQGNENYLGTLESVEHKDIIHTIQLSQRFVEENKNSVEKDINGELLLVIKSNA
jgi:hypothetical protein